MSEVKPPALSCTYRSVSPQGRIQWWKGQALMVWHSCMLMSESPFFSATLQHPLHKPEGCHTACSPTSAEHFTARWRYLSTDPHHCQFRTGCSAVWQVAELPLNFPDGKPGLTSWEWGFAFISWVALQISSLTFGRLQVQGYKRWQAGSQLEWRCSSQNFVTALSVVAILSLCLCHPTTEMTCRTCEVHGGTQCVLIYSGSTDTWVFILQRIRRKGAFPAVLWRALLADSPFLGLFLLVQSICGSPSLPHPADTLDSEVKASAQNPGACWLYQNAATSILEGL